MFKPIAGLFCALLVSVQLIASAQAEQLFLRIQKYWGYAIFYHSGGDAATRLLHCSPEPPCRIEVNLDPGKYKIVFAGKGHPDAREAEAEMVEVSLAAGGRLALLRGQRSIAVSGNEISLKLTRLYLVRNGFAGRWGIEHWPSTKPFDNDWVDIVTFQTQPVSFSDGQGYPFRMLPDGRVERVADAPTYYVRKDTAHRGKMFLNTLDVLIYPLPVNPRVKWTVSNSGVAAGSGPRVFRLVKGGWYQMSVDTSLVTYRPDEPGRDYPLAFEIGPWCRARPGAIPFRYAASSDNYVDRTIFLVRPIRESCGY